MKVAIFFDGQNFYRSLLRYDESLRVDYDRLATWITQQAGGANALFSGAYYYVGVSPDAPPLVEGFLKGLELRPGYFVKREPRVRRAGRCPGCGKEYEYTTEKRVDTRLVADLIHYAASNAFDAAVLSSSADELSKDLRVRCFGHIHLSDGVSGFRAERRPYERASGRVPAVRPPRPAMSPAASSQPERGLQELQRAEARLPHVGRGYFVMRWKSHALPPPGPEREALIQQLVDAGLAEEFETRDAEGRSVTAIRSREPDGNTREPDGNVALPE